MEPTTVVLLSVVALVALVLAGVHVAIALGFVSFTAIWVIQGDIAIALDFTATTTYRSLQVYEFGVVPLFILMGVILGKTKLSIEVFAAANVLLYKIRGSLAMATVIGNAGFAAVTGSSIASAAAFTGIAYSPMRLSGYDRRLIVGSIAGSSVLGMLIPPSVLLIIYGILAQVSIGQLFLAGVIPGIILAVIYCLGIAVIARLRPESVGDVATLDLPAEAPSTEAVAGGEVGPGAPEDPTGADTSQPTIGGDLDAQLTEELRRGADASGSTWRTLVRPWPVAVLIVVVLGGIYGGVFTATEAGAVGALGAILVALAKRELSWKKFHGLLVATGVTTGSLLILLVTAQMFSRVLALSGALSRFQRWIAGLEIAPVLILMLFLGVIILLGMLIDSTSILLIVVPVAFPILTGFGYNPIWLGIVIVVAVEMGLITPPFGLVAYTVKAALGDEVELEDVFLGSIPFIVLMLVFLVLLVAFPWLSIGILG